MNTFLTCLRNNSIVLLVASTAVFRAELPTCADDTQAQVQAAKVNYITQIEPIFRQHCQGCHQPAKAEGGLIMTNPNILLEKGGDNGMVIIAGKSMRVI